MDTGAAVFSECRECRAPPWMRQHRSRVESSQSYFNLKRFFSISLKIILYRVACTAEHPLLPAKGNRARQENTEINRSSTPARVGRSPALFLGTSSRDGRHDS